MNKLAGLCAVLMMVVTVGALAQTNDTEKKTVTLGLNHIGLTVKHLEKSAAFFIDTLGWRRAGGEPDYPSVFVTDGNMFVTLWQTQDPEHVIDFDRKNNVGLHHLAITVDNLDALHELHEQFKSVDGLVIEFGPELNGKGPTTHMMIREPSGNRLEFVVPGSRIKKPE